MITVLIFGLAAFAYAIGFGISYAYYHYGWMALCAFAAILWTSLARLEWLDRKEVSDPRPYIEDFWINHALSPAYGHPRRAGTLRRPVQPAGTDGPDCPSRTW